MNKKIKAFLSALIYVVIIFVLFAVPVSAEELTQIPEHKLSFEIPDGYVLLNLETAEDNEELIESLGYSVSSFKNFLKRTDVNSAKTLFLCIETDSKSQISAKCWATDFSKRIGDLSNLNDEALSKTAKELVTTKGASYKSVSVNGLKLIEVRSDAADSGGEFCTVQYITICNENFYSLNFTFAGKVDDVKIQSAWDAITTLKIKSNSNNSSWDFGSIILVVLIGVAIIVAVFVAAFIVVSLIKDAKNSGDASDINDYIERRK